MYIFEVFIKLRFTGIAYPHIYLVDGKTFFRQELSGVFHPFLIAVFHNGHTGLFFKFLDQRALADNRRAYPRQRMRIAYNILLFDAFL